MLTESFQIQDHSVEYIFFWSNKDGRIPALAQRQILLSFSSWSDFLISSSTVIFISAVNCLVSHWLSASQSGLDSNCFISAVNCLVSHWLSASQSGLDSNCFISAVNCLVSHWLSAIQSGLDSNCFPPLTVCTMSGSDVSSPLWVWQFAQCLGLMSVSPLWQFAQCLSLMSVPPFEFDSLHNGSDVGFPPLTVCTMSGSDVSVTQDWYQALVCPALKVSCLALGLLQMRHALT